MRSVYSYNGQKCPIKGCKKPKEWLGHCGKHAQRIHRYGDPDYVTPEEIRLSRLRASQPNLGKAKKTTYLKLNGRHMHRVVFEMFLGRKLKRNEIVHHIDGNRHNNDISNLEMMSQARHASLHHAEANNARNKNIKKRKNETS